MPRWWRSRRAIQIRQLIGVGLLGYVALNFLRYGLSRDLALFYGGFILVMLSLDLCASCGKLWILDPLSVWRDGYCRRCEAPLP